MLGIGRASIVERYYSWSSGYHKTGSYVIPPATLFIVTPGYPVLILSLGLVKNSRNREADDYIQYISWNPSNRRTSFCRNQPSATLIAVVGTIRFHQYFQCLRVQEWWPLVFHHARTGWQKLSKRKCVCRNRITEEDRCSAPVGWGKKQIDILTK